MSKLEVADIFRRHGEAWRTANARHLSHGQLRVMSAIEACRTATLGGHVEQCEDCAHTRIAYNSCRNRHCPKCQWSAAAEWLAARQAELLPVPYFHVVFTLPAQIGPIAYQNKAKVYGILFKAAAEALTIIAADPKHLGARIGLTAALHTWGQNLDHHPHVHCIVPGGGVSIDGERWVACIKNPPQRVCVDILVNTEALAVTEFDLDQAPAFPGRYRRWRLDRLDAFCRGDLHRNKVRSRRSDSRQAGPPPPCEHQTRRNAVPPRDLRHNRARRQRLLNDPHLIVARPATATLNPAQNFYPHLPTLRLALKLDPRRIPGNEQGGPPRRNTFLMHTLPDIVDECAVFLRTPCT
jgi:hypothetical protein